jgi:hypothetical protein
MHLAPSGIRSLLLFGAPLGYKPDTARSRDMAHNYSVNDNVHHLRQGPQGRAGVAELNIYTIVACLPVESDGRLRYRIKSKSDNVERVVTEEQLSRLG